MEGRGLEATADALVRLQHPGHGGVRVYPPGGGDAHTAGHRGPRPRGRALRQPRVQPHLHGAEVMVIILQGVYSKVDSEMGLL